MTTGHDRRRFLQIAGTGAAASIAGCASLNPLSDDTDDTLTVAVGPSTEDIEELQDEVEAGELDPMDAQQREQELVSDAVADFQERADSESELTIEESTEEMGIFRVEASSELIIDALIDGEVAAIQTGAAYDQFMEQQEQQEQQQEQEPEIDEEELEEELEGQEDDTDDEDDGDDETEASSDDE